MLAPFICYDKVRHRIKSDVTGNEPLNVTNLTDRQAVFSEFR